MLDDAHIFHVNVNCSDLARSREFYLDGCGLIEGVRTTPEHPQPGDAFGFDRAWWDAVILVGARGFEGGAVDLLQWLEPTPTGTPPMGLAEPGFQRIGLRVPGDRTFPVGLRRDPDGTAVELVEGEPSGLAFVAVTSHDLEVSVAFYVSLGFQEVARLDGPDPWVEAVLDAPDPGEVQLRLVGFEAPTGPPGVPRPANALGMWRTALLLPDLDGAVGRLRDAGVELLSDPQSMAMGPGLPELRFVCFRGPDREVIELIESPAPG